MQENKLWHYPDVSSQVCRLVVNISCYFNFTIYKTKFLQGIYSFNTHVYFIHLARCTWMYSDHFRMTCHPPHFISREHAVYQMLKVWKKVWVKYKKTFGSTRCKFGNSECLCIYSQMSAVSPTYKLAYKRSTFISDTYTCTSMDMGILAVYSKPA